MDAGAASVTFDWRSAGDGTGDYGKQTSPKLPGVACRASLSGSPPGDPERVALHSGRGRQRSTHAFGLLLSDSATCAAAYNHDLTECCCPFCGSDRTVEAQ